jgi:signal transduction histidine kinase
VPSSEATTASSGCCCTASGRRAIPARCALCWRRRPCRSSSRGCGSSCGCSSPRSSPRARIAHAGYEERRRIERDLHDGAQQRLVTLGIVLRRLQRSLPREARILDAPLDAAVDEVAGAIADLRTIAAGVRPPRLDEGLAAALDDLARAAPGVRVDVVADAERFPPETEAAAYFVACEALTNAVKHAAPTRVLVETRAATACCGC